MPGDWADGTSSLSENIVQSKNYLYLMDLYGQGSLETLSFQVNRSVIVEVIDGGIRQKEYNRDFPSWIRRIDSSANPASARSVAEIIILPDGGYIFGLKKLARFGSRLIVRLFNPQLVEARVGGFYLEGTLRCM